MAFGVTAGHACLSKQRVKRERASRYAGAWSISKAHRSPAPRSPAPKKAEHLRYLGMNYDVILALRYIAEPAIPNFCCSPCPLHVRPHAVRVFCTGTGRARGGREHRVLRESMRTARHNLSRKKRTVTRLDSLGPCESRRAAPLMRPCLRSPGLGSWLLSSPCPFEA
jgi:hypothetical protein